MGTKKIKKENKKVTELDEMVRNHIFLFGEGVLPLCPQ